MLAQVVLREIDIALYIVQQLFQPFLTMHIVTAGRSRLRPVLMTTLTTILGMVPMAVGQGEGAEMWRPLGVAVIGGLTVSTILTLILVPVLYCSFAGVGIRRTRKKIKKDRELNDYYQLHKEKMTKPRKQ